MDLNHLNIIVILSFLKYLTLCCGQVIQFGRCSDVSTQKYFRLDRFIGHWYEIQRFPAWYENQSQCASKFIISCERKIEIQHIYIRNNIQYILHVNSSYHAGDDAVFYINETNIDPIGIPLSVVGTDYQNYALIYGCRYNQEMNMRYMSSWILSRNRTLEKSYINTAYDQLSSISAANIIYFEAVEQDPDKCRYEWTAHVHAENINTNDDEENKST